MKNFDEYMLSEILKEEGIELSDQEIRQLIAEGFMDKMKKWGKNAALAGVMGASALGGGGNAGQAPAPHAQPQAQVQQQAQDANPFTLEQGPDKEAFDSYTQENPTMTPQQWTQYASKYPQSGRLGFVPSSEVAGQWIPAGGADSVRVQGATQIKNDELERDDVGLTPYKDGKAMGATNWSHQGKQQTPLPGSTLSKYQQQLNQR
jgi:hypothetical protein